MASEAIVQTSAAPCREPPRRSAIASLPADARHDEGEDRAGDPGKQADVTWHQDAFKGTTWSPPRAHEAPSGIATLRAMTDDSIRTRRLLLARPRGYCAGVERAVDTVERLLEQHGPPVYVRKQIVHNIHVVRRLEERGAVFVESEQDVPRGRDLRALGTRGRSRGLPQRIRAQPADGRRHLPARHEGAQGGPSLRRGRLHDLPRRACGARGGRGHQGRGSRRDHARRERRRCRRARADRSASASPT